MSLSNANFVQRFIAKTLRGFLPDNAVLLLKAPQFVPLFPTSHRQRGAVCACALCLADKRRWS